MNLEFLSIQVKNFRSYGNVPIKYDFMNGLDLINGTNGNGKTSLLLHGIIFNLFGDGLNGEKVNDLINNINKKNMEVELELLANDVHYKIVRGRKPNFLTIYKDESDIPLDSISIKEDDNYILYNILSGIDKNVFLKLFTIQANNAEISIFRMNTAERRKLLESLFDLTVFTEMKQINIDNINELNIDKLGIDRENSGLDATLNAQVNNISSINKFIESITQRLSNDNNILKQKEKDIKDFEDNIIKEIDLSKKDLIKIKDDKSKINFDLIKKQKVDLSSKKELITKNIFTVDNAINNIEKLLLELQENKIKSVDLKSKLLDEVIVNEKTTSKKTFEENIKVGRTEITSIDTKFKMEAEFLLNVGECANGNKQFLDCVKKKFGSDQFNKDDWNNRVKPQLLKDIISRESDIKDIDKTLRENTINSNSFDMISKSISKIGENIMLNLKILTEVGNIKKDINVKNYKDIWNLKKDSLIIDSSNIDKEIFKIEKEIEIHNNLVKDIYMLEKSIKEKERLNSDSLLKDVANIKLSIDKIEKDIIENKKQLELSEKEVVKIKEKIKENLEKNKKIKEDLDSKEELGKFLKDEKIKYFIIKQSFPLLKKEFNQILKRLFHGEIRVNIDDKFDIEVYRNGEIQNFEAFSEGEKKRLDLGFVFTVHEFLSQKNQLSVNILIMDELLDSALDSAGTDTVIEYLSEMKVSRNIILVTHKAENIDYDRKFVITKDKKFSKIEEV